MSAIIKEENWIGTNEAAELIGYAKGKIFQDAKSEKHGSLSIPS